jgi:hypothetical protein
MVKGRGKAQAKARSLHIKSKQEVKELDHILNNGNSTIVVVVVGWCGACQRVKPMWMNALKKKNQKNLVVVENEQLPSTSLRSLNITHFPSTFEIPAGGTPTLLSNPQDIKGVNETLNANASAEAEPDAEAAAEAEEPSTQITASQFVERNETMRTPSPTVRHENNRPRNSFTPSLEKLKGGRRTRRRRQQKQQQKKQQSRRQTR